MYIFNIKKGNKIVKLCCLSYSESIESYSLNFGSHIHIFPKNSVKKIDKKL